ncbi:hypothetical protein GGS21DRAFT_332873 [Xylaria nigripes]|nr:hypothetical protein GGS21DRAFT_332873 [Xylaria nigripes]
MDPLSITASVIALVGAANNVYNILQAIRHADRGLQALNKEVSTLSGFLRSIEKALEDCRSSPYALTHIDLAFWKESKDALADCQETLDGLGLILIKGPKRLSRSNSLFRKARVAAELRSRAGEIASFREKISMSNLSLQTLLQVVNVSLTLRSNESQDHILRELKELKDAIKKSAQVATISYSALYLDDRDHRLVRHLKGLIQAAHEFHESASTTASTVAGSGETHTPPTEFGDDDVRSGFGSRLPTMKIRQIETFLSENQRVGNASSTSSQQQNEEITPPRLQDLETPFNTIFTNGFSKIAQRALQQFDLLKAEGHLKEALKWYNSSGSEDKNHCRRLQTQLALCNLLQGNRQEAKELIFELVNSSAADEVVAHQLLYALALLQAHDLDFDEARYTSKKLWEALQRMPHCTTLRATDVMKVLATSYQETGNSLLADAIEAEVPDLRLREPVPRMVDFLVKCEELLDNFIGLQDCSDDSNAPSLAEQIHQLPIATRPSSLQMRQQLKDKPPSLLETISEGVDDSSSTKTFPNPTKRNLKARGRSWSNLRAFITTLRTGPQDSASDTEVEIFARHRQMQRHFSRLRKRVKMSNFAHKSSKDVSSRFPAYSVPGMHNSRKPKWNWLSRTSPVRETHHDLEGNSTTVGCEIKPADNNSSSTTNEHDVSDEHSQPLQRQFSFRAGLPDFIPPQITCHELVNSAVIAELMDTSSAPADLSSQTQTSECSPDNCQPDECVSEPGILDESCMPRPLFPDDRDSTARMDEIYYFGDSSEQTDGHDRDLKAATEDISQQMEDSIYDLLGYFKPTHKLTEKSLTSALSRTPSSASLSGFSSYKPDSNHFSDFDRMTHSTRRTSFSDSEYDFDVKYAAAPSSPVRMKSQHTAEPGYYDQPPRPISPLGGLNDREYIVEPDQPPRAFPASGSVDETINEVSQPRNLQHRLRSIYRNRQNGLRPPRRTLAKRRPSGNRIARLPRMFNRHRQRSEDDIRFGFGNSLYSGPDAVAGPFTDPGEMDLTTSAEERRELSSGPQ